MPTEGWRSHHLAMVLATRFAALGMTAPGVPSRLYADRLLDNGSTLRFVGESGPHFGNRARHHWRRRGHQVEAAPRRAARAFAGYTESASDP